MLKHKTSRLLTHDTSCQVPPTKYYILLFVCLLSNVVWSQRPGAGSLPRESSSNRSNGRTQREIAPDTTNIFIFNVDNPNEEKLFSDSLLDNFQQYDPSRLQKDDYGHLGLPGSAHYPLVFKEEIKLGLDLGWHAYDLYHIDGHSLPYYRIKRPISNLWFTQGATQINNIVKAQFSRPFAKGVTFGIDYQAITQKGRSAQFPNQRNQTRALSTGLWMQSKNNRYDGFISFSANTTTAEDNGGLITLPETGGEFTSAITAEVFLADGQKRYALRELMYTQYYRLGGQTDSLGNSSRAFTLSHQLEIDQNKYRFDDPYSIADDSFFVFFPHLKIDPRGTRYFVQHNTVANSFRLSTFRGAINKKQGARQQSDLLEVGITHQYHAIHMEPRDTSVQNLLLTGKIGLRPGNKDRLRLQADAALALLDQAGDYHIRAFMDVNLGKVGTLRFKLTNQLYSPTFLQNNFRLTQNVLWDNNFDKTLETTLGASYSLPKYKFMVEGQYHLLNNYIYYDSLAFPRQEGSPISIFQLKLQKDFQLGHFHLNNSVVLQKVNEDVIELPTLVGKHSLYYEGKWFKVLDVQLGADARYTAAFKPAYYNPFIGQFILQERQEVDFYPNVDFFFTFKVSRFKAFFKWENASESFGFSQRYFYTSAFSPWPEATFVFGINWRMLD